MSSKAIIILALCIVLNAAIASADNNSATPNNSNNITILGAKSVVITENANGLKAVVETDNDSLVFEQSYQPNATVVSHLSSSGFSLSGGQRKNIKESSVSWEMISNGIGFGFCSAPGAPDEAGIEMGKSFEISWLNILAAQATNRFGNSFSLGVGINWRNYRTTLENCFTVNDGQVNIGQYPEGAEPRLSRIKIFSVQFPLLYGQRLPFGIYKEHMVLRFGPIFNLNSHASVLTAWHDDKRSSEYKVNGINVRPFTIDLFASLHVCSFVSLYARYSPYYALTGHHGPNFHQFSTGLLFMM